MGRRPLRDFARRVAFTHGDDSSWFYVISREEPTRIEGLC